MINYYYCIDGDDKFFELLRYNLRNHSNGTLIKALLSDYNNKSERSLLRTHPGTASAQGDLYSEAITLDELLLEVHKVNNIDLIKIDVDGLDGKVITGAGKTIERFKPVIIFEWHPILYNKTSNSPYQPFHELLAHGYNQFVLFDKLGNFSQIHNNISDNEIDFLTQLCLRNKYGHDWHYDVIALNKISGIDTVQLAESAYAKNC